MVTLVWSFARETRKRTVVEIVQFLKADLSFYM